MFDEISEALAGTAVESGADIPAGTDDLTATALTMLFTAAAILFTSFVVVATGLV